MKIQFSAPSKTFLLGEYLALERGPALLMSTTPRFECKIEQAGEGSCEGIHLQSPAGLFIRENNLEFQNTNFKFIDPHLSAGGFGASGAQFLFAYLWQYLAVQGITNKSVTPALVKEMWRTFQYLMDEKGQRGSGYDFLAQFVGGFSYVQADPWILKELEWKFRDETLLLFKTGQKTVTHNSLKTIPAFPKAELAAIVEKAEAAFISGDASGFSSGLNEYQEQLLRLGLLIDEVKSVRKELMAVDGVLATKGCGAMGADVVLVFCKTSAALAVQKRAEQLRLSFAATHLDLSAGLSIGYSDLALESEQTI